MILANVCKLCKDITTGRDNQTHDIARIIMLVNAVLLVPVLIIGMVAFVYGWFLGKPFDVQTMFNAALTYVGGVGALMTSGAAAIYFKKSTEPDGTITSVESITKGKQPDTAVTNVTEVVQNG